MKEPKNLGIKIGSKEEIEWKKIKDTQEEVLRNSKINIKVAENVLKLAEEQIDLEKERFK